MIIRDYKYFVKAINFIYAHHINSASPGELIFMWLSLYPFALTCTIISVFKKPQVLSAYDFLIQEMSGFFHDSELKELEKFFSSKEISEGLKLLYKKNISNKEIVDFIRNHKNCPKSIKLLK